MYVKNSLIYEICLPFMIFKYNTTRYCYAGSLELDTL